ncbi:hypothetical protein QO259_01140 [Salinicola sp. JS01]|uniref:hypothetical protein n=1 Tax=Salinicola sp. JS01 TaxID=3050071 RepID=UPI00255B8C6D|nr:hypothetical protein [Salinicola sp. JS01]WIX33292.1 hypothetical protein QO259_01140 [Salinicola sp. JS01]
MANDSPLQVTLTADARPLTGVLRDSAQALGAFADDAERSGQRFAAAMAQSARPLETVNGHLQRLEALGRVAMGTLSELGASASGGAPGVGELNQRLEDMISAYGRVSAPLTEFADALPTQNARAETLSNTLRAVGGAAGGTAVLLEGYRVATLSASAATTIFNAVVRANPLVRIATLGAAAAGALYSLRDATVEVNGETLSLGDLATPVMHDLANGAITVANTLARHLGPGVEKIADDIGALDFNTVVTQSAAAIDEALRLWGGFTEALSTAWDKFVITLGPRMVEQLNPVLAQMSDLANWKPFWLKGVLPDWDFDFTLKMPDEVETANAGRTLGEAFMTGYNMTAAFGPSATDYISKVVGDAATNRQLKQFQGVVEAIFSPAEKGADQLDALGNGVRHAGAAAATASRQIQDQANALQALEDRLDPVAASQRAFQTDTQTLNRSVAMGAITFDRYFDLVDKLQHAYQNSGDAAQIYGFDASQAAKTATRETSVLSRTLDQMVAGLDDTFQGFWTRMLGGAKVSFEGLKSQAISTLAEIIHAYTTKRIVASLGLPLAGTGSAAAGGIDGGGGGLPDLSSLGSTIYSGGAQLAGNAWRAFQGTGSTYAGTFGSELVATGNGGFISGLNSIANSSMFANAALGIGGGIAGGYVGTKAGESLFGKQANSNYGALIGAGLGQAFIPIPGLGAALGGLAGGMVDSIFGSSRKYTAGFESFAETPDRDFGAGGTPYYSSGYYRDGDLGRGRETAFGSFGFTDKTKFEPSDMIDMLDAMAALDQTLASAANETQIESVKNALDGWQTRLKNDSLGELVARRYAVVSETLENEASEATAKLIERVGEITADSAERTIPQLAQALQLGNLIDGLSGNVKTYAEKVVDDTSTSLEDAFSQITAGVAAHAAVSGIADELNLTFDDMGERAVEAALNLQELAGGLDALQSQAQTYYANFFSAEEQRQRAIDQIAPTLEAAGLSAESTRAQFRAVVESLDLNTESDRQTYSELMSVAGAFAQLSESAADAAKRAEEIERQRWSLQNDLLRAQGNGEAALARERQRQLEQMPETLRALQQEIWAIDERNKAAEQQALLQRTALYRDGTVGAVDGLIDRYQRAMEVAQTAADERQRQLENEKRALATIGDMLDAMRLSDQSILSPAERLAESRRQFAALQVRAEAGDTDALSQLGQAKTTYLTAAGDYYGQASAPYAAIYTEVESALSGLEDQYGESLEAQGSLENVQRQVLEAQRQARNTLLSSLEQQVQQSTRLQSIADLVSLLPPSLADSLSAIFPEYATDVGSSFDAAAYLANKTAQVNAIGYAGRSDWTVEQVLAAIEQAGMTPYEHYQRYGRDEGVSPTYQPGEDTVSQQIRRFDEDTYVANQVAYLNDRDRGERTWSGLQFYMALNDANLSAYEHWLRYGRAEGVSAYARDSAAPSVSRAEARPVVATYSARRVSTDDGLRTVSEPPLWESTARAGVDVAPVVAELRALRRDNAELRARLDALVDASSDTAAHTRAAAAHSQRTADGIAENNRRSRTSQRMPA